jgi:hypothetical protein
MEGDIPGPAPAEVPPLSIKEQLDHGLKVFQFLADQRLKAFHFYILLLTASAAATLSAHQSGKLNLMSQFAICALHFIIPIVFMLLEQRNVVLLNTAASSLREIENQPGFPQHLKAFQADSRSKRRFAWLISYRRAINIAHVSQLLFGLILLSVWIAEWPSAPSSASHEKGARSAEFNRIKRPESTKMRTKKTKKSTTATTRELSSGGTE